MRNVYIGLLLESIRFVLQTFATDYGDQTIETVRLRGISSPGVELGIVGKVISEQSIVLPFFVVFEIVLGR